MSTAKSRPISRRSALGALGAIGAGARRLAATRRGGGYGPTPKVAEGTLRDVEQYAAGSPLTGEWWVPSGSSSSLPTVVLVHGGYWRPGFDRSLEDALAADLAGRGFLIWNIDYRPSADPWPATLSDVAAGFDHVTTGRHADRVDPTRVAVVGHSAGGHLALWLASRTRLPQGAPGSMVSGPRVALAVPQAPVASFRRASKERLGGGAVDALLGGSPAQVPDRLAAADPIALLPSGVRTVLIHGTGDKIVPISQSEDYVAAATAKGGDARLVRVPGGHFEHLDPGSPACAALREALATL